MAAAGKRVRVGGRSCGGDQRHHLVLLLTLVTLLGGCSLVNGVGLSWSIDAAIHCPVDAGGWPVPALLASGLVPVHVRPDHQAPRTTLLMGPRIADDDDDYPQTVTMADGSHWCFELGVAHRAGSDDDEQWAFIQCSDNLQGWVPADRLVIEPQVSPLRRLAARIRRDYGTVSAVAELLWGEPEARSNSRLSLPDFHIEVTVDDYRYVGHRASYWDDRLQSVTVAGGFMDFGGLALGLPVACLQRLLGEPQYRDDALLLYAEGTDEIQFLTAGQAISGMLYRRVLYE